MSNAAAQIARRTSRNAPPESQVRPKATKTQSPPAPPAEAVESIDVRAARTADEYAAIRVEIADLEEKRKALEARLKRDMAAAEKRRFNTAHGLVSLIPAGESKTVTDLDAAVTLLESRGLPQPPSMEDWLRQHGLQTPTKVKPGAPEKIEFRRA